LTHNQIILAMAFIVSAISFVRLWRKSAPAVKKP
jgi:hypothetical protein